MLLCQGRVLSIVVPDGIDIILADPARQIDRAELPEAVIRHLRGIYHRHLPRQLRIRMVMRKWCPILLQHNWLSHLRTHVVMLLDPRTAPSIVVTPGVRVQVKSAIVEGGDLQVRGEVDADIAAVGVAAVANAVGRREPAFIAQRHHVVGVKGLDVCARVGGPVRDDGCGAPLAARLIAELPREDGGGGLVSVHDHVDVGAVSGLGGL